MKLISMQIPCHPDEMQKQPLAEKFGGHEGTSLLFIACELAWHI